MLNWPETGCSKSSEATKISKAEILARPSWQIEQYPDTKYTMQTKKWSWRFRSDAHALHASSCGADVGRGCETRPLKQCVLIVSHMKKPTRKPWKSRSFAQGFRPEHVDFQSVRQPLLRSSSKLKAKSHRRNPKA